MGPDAGIGDVEGLSANHSFPRLTEALGETQSVARYVISVSCVYFLLCIDFCFIYVWLQTWPVFFSYLNNKRKIENVVNYC